jgi:signal transduction histidine kinase
MFSIALVCYAVAQNLWLAFEQYLTPDKVPFPSWPDLFYLLQYPFFFLALALLPGLSRQGQPRIIRVKLVLDSVLLAAAGTALSWYFILAPIYIQSAQSSAGKAVNLAYPVGDLVLLVGLILVFTRWCRQIPGRVAIYLLVAAVLFLIMADSWYAYLNLYAKFQTGDLPDVFWIACYLAFALASLVQLRSAQLEATGQVVIGDETVPQLAGGLRANLRLLAPFVAALLASAAIVGRAVITPGDKRGMVAPFLVSLALLVLVTARQGIAVLENDWLRREREEARANELAMREATRQMDTFLGIASHELKTPLTTMILGIQVIRRRLQAALSNSEAVADKITTRIENCQEALDDTFHQAKRLDRLVNDLLDTSRIRQGQLKIHLQPADLTSIVRLAVEEQRQAAPERIISLHMPEASALPIVGDPDRIGQVVTNYLTNALKYSPEESPILVGVHADQQCGRVWVRDQGPGLSSAAQERLWERFHRVQGIEVQSGSGVGLGLGLHISKTIVEQHHGKVGVESVPGQGSTFWFTLPLTRQEAC